MKDLIIELYSEEIPAKMQKNAESGFAKIFSNFFSEYKIEFSDLVCFAGPCRIVISAKIAEIVPPTHSEIKGPKVGTESRALEGFCKKNNCASSDLTIKKMNDHEFYFLCKMEDEKRSIEIIREHFASIAQSYVWPKSMVWGPYSLYWVRPLKSILCLYGNEVVKLQIGHIHSSNQTFGHKFMSKDSIIVQNSNEYFAALEKSDVVIDRNIRKATILDSLETICAGLNITLNFDEDLLEEVAGLCEYPVVLCSAIETKFMTLPEEVLVTALKTHQKYFTAKDVDNNLAPYFLFACNLKLENYDAIISGNVRVLNARLSDALYFYQNDLSTPIEYKTSKLSNIIYHKNLGTMRDKALRIEAITKELNPEYAVAAQLAKCDLVSEMVGEFPELQGIMGGYYAKILGYSNEICDAIKNHYLPHGLHDTLPTEGAAILAIADKIDNLVSLYVAGERATGTRDPYALRRHALGLIRIIYHNNIELDLVKLIKFSGALYGINAKESDIDEIIDFVQERMKYYFKNTLPIEILNASINLRARASITTIMHIAGALHRILPTESGQTIISLYKRAKNISASAIIDHDVSLDRWNESEIKFLDCINRATKEMNIQTKKHDYDACLKVLLSLKDPLAEFFADNLINTEDAEVSNRRKSLLLRASLLFDQIANFNLL